MKPLWEQSLSSGRTIPSSSVISTSTLWTVCLITVSSWRTSFLVHNLAVFLCTIHSLRILRLIHYRRYLVSLGCPLTMITTSLWWTSEKILRSISGPRIKGLSKSFATRWCRAKRSSMEEERLTLVSSMQSPCSLETSHSRTRTSLWTKRNAMRCWRRFFLTSTQKLVSVSWTPWWTSCATSIATPTSTLGSWFSSSQTMMNLSRSKLPGSWLKDCRLMSLTLGVYVSPSESSSRTPSISLLRKASLSDANQPLSSYCKLDSNLSTHSGRIRNKL